MQKTILLLALILTLTIGRSSSLFSETTQDPQQTYIEWIKFELLNNLKRGDLQNLLKKTIIPALNKSGCAPVGVFRPKYGAHGNEVYLLVPHPSIDSFLTTWDNMLTKDAVEQSVKTMMSDPYYERFESSLMRAFSHMPQVEIPETVKGKKERIFELRIYESHSRFHNNRKIEMFNEGGEIQVFRETGLHPVFFGQTLAGPLMPNLIYMLGFENMEQRDKHWEQFIQSDGWNAMKGLSRYKQTVSSITDIILQPLPCSQI